MARIDPLCAILFSISCPRSHENLQGTNDRPAADQFHKSACCRSSYVHLGVAGQCRPERSFVRRALKDPCNMDIGRRRWNYCDYRLAADFCSDQHQSILEFILPKSILMSRGCGGSVDHYCGISICGQLSCRRFQRNLANAINAFESVRPCPKDVAAALAIPAHLLLHQF